MPNAASVALICGGEVLLIKRSKSPYAGYWTLPGGRRDDGETIEACARREIFEELGFTINGLVPVCQLPGDATYVLQVFVARWQNSVPHPSDEIAEWQWVTLEDTVTLRTTPGLADILTLALGCLNNT